MANKVEERLKAIPEPITQLIEKVRKGDADARNQLWEVILPLLKQKAEADLRGNNVGGVMRPSDLAQDAAIELIKREEIGWKDRVHLYAFAATAMRHIMIDRARKHLAGNRAPLPIDELLGEASQNDVTMIEMDELLDQLAAREPAKARVVELRLFGGLTNDEIAEVTGLSLATVKRHLTFSRAFLLSRINGGKEIKE